jgi:hypothetical protein
MPRQSDWTSDRLPVPQPGSPGVRPSAEQRVDVVVELREGRLDQALVLQVDEAEGRALVFAMPFLLGRGISST